MKIRIISIPRNASKWHHALGGHLFDNGGHYDENGNWIPAMTWNPINSSPFNPNYRLAPELQINGIDTPNDWRYWTPPTNLNFKPNGISEPTRQNPYNSKSKNPNLPTSGWQSYLRYAPVLGSALLLGHTLANKPDYSYANELEEAANQYASSMNTNITPRFLGDYLAYRPFDRLFYANELGAQEAAERAAIMQASNGNTGAAMAGLLASGYNRNVGLGKLFREGDEYNLAQRQKVAEFNRVTNQYNSQADLAAQQTNARLNAAKAEMLLNNKYRTTAMKQAIDDARANTIAANLSGLFDNLGGIGTEAQQKYWMNGLINSGWAYTPSEDMLAAWGYPRACGGKMNRRKKKGITI